MYGAQSPKTIAKKTNLPEHGVRNILMVLWMKKQVLEVEGFKGKRLYKLNQGGSK